MKSKQLLSIVFSLIMFTGVTAGSVAFAETDDVIDSFDDCVEAGGVIGDNPDECTLDDMVFVNDEDDDIIEDFEDCVEAGGVIGDNPNECTLDDAVFVNDEDDDNDDVIDSFEDCVEAGNPVMESYPEQCMTTDGTVFVNEKQVDDYDDDYDDDKYADGDKFYVCHNGKNTISIAESAVRAHLTHGDSMKKCPDAVRNSDDKMHDKYSNKGTGNLRDHFAMYCDMTPELREEKLQMHDDLPEDLRADMARYCEMTDDEQDDFRDIMMDKMDMLKDHMKDRMHTDKDMRYSLEKYCEMSEDDRAAYIAEHDKTEDKAAKMDRYCTLDEDGRTDFIAEHQDEYKAYMKDKMTDKKHDFDAMSDMAKDRMSDKAMDKKHDKMKFSDQSPRLKAMIMSKHDISDERMDEIKMKYREKHGDLTDERKSDLKMKFKNHMAKVKSNLTADQKSDIHDRIAEMKAFKADLRERSSDITDEEKQELRAEFIEKAKDMRHAWISPRTQMTAGVDAAEVECKEGFSLVMKASNGVAMCLYSDTALKMIDRGLVVPAN